MEEQLFARRTDLTALNQAVVAIRNEIKKVIVGQDEMVKLIIAALLADGHVLRRRSRSCKDINCEVGSSVA